MANILTISATEAKSRLGEYIEQAHREPVRVQKSGRNSVVILDNAEYERLTAMEDAYWGMKASLAKASGFIGTEAANAFVQGRLNEE